MGKTIETYSPGLEREILGAIMAAAIKGNDLLHEAYARIPDSDRFALAAHSGIYSAMLSIRGYGMATIGRVGEQLRLKGALDEVSRSGVGDVLEYLKKLAVEATARTRGDFLLALDQLSHYSAMRKFSERLLIAQSDSINAVDGAGDFVAILTRDLWAIADGHLTQSNGSDSAECYQMHLAYMRALKPDAGSDGTLAFQTGIVRLDTLLRGGVRGGVLMTVAAHSGVGKSTLGTMFLIWNGVHGELFPCLLSFEMKRVEIQERITAYLANVDVGKLAEPWELSEHEQANIRTVENILVTKPRYWIEEMNGATIDQVEAKVRILQATMGTRLVIVDYVQLIRTTKGHNREREVASITAKLKALALELGIVIVILAQLNRAMHSRPSNQQYPQEQDLRESSSLYQDADIVLFIDRPEIHHREYFAQIREDDPILRSDGLVRIHVAKFRRGRPGNVIAKFIPQFALFGDYVPDDHLPEYRGNDYSGFTNTYSTSTNDEPF